MSELDSLFGSSYCDSFSGKSYLQSYYSSAQGSEDEGGLLSFILTNLYDFFEEVSGKRLLEIGCGPCIHCAAAGSKHFDQIVMADYSPALRDEVEIWLKNDPEAFDWSPLLQYFAKRDGLNVSDVAERLRAKKPMVIPCDVTKDGVIDTALAAEKFDAVASCLCFEAACRSVDEFKQALNRAAKLLNHGGHFIMHNVLEETFYQVGDKRFSCLSLSEGDVLAAIEAANLEVLHKRHMAFDRAETSVSDFGGVLSVLARKRD